MREIRAIGDPVLRTPAEPVTDFDRELRRLIEEMFEAMYAVNGVGLAAPQIGVLQRVVVVDTSSADEDVKPFAMINPEILETEGTIRYREGCLSVPGEAEEVERAARVKVRFLDRDGNPVEMEATGLTAVCIQHECDHLNGVVFVDRLSALKRERIKKRMKRRKAERASQGVEA